MVRKQSNYFLYQTRNSRTGGANHFYIILRRREPFFTSISWGGEPFLHVFQGGGARRFLMIILKVLPRTCPITIAPSLTSVGLLVGLLLLFAKS